MAKKKDEKDVLVVRDEKTGEISVVAGLNADGTPKRTPPKLKTRRVSCNSTDKATCWTTSSRTSSGSARNPAASVFTASRQTKRILLDVMKHLLKIRTRTKNSLPPHKIDTSYYEKVQEEMATRKTRTSKTGKHGATKRTAGNSEQTQGKQGLPAHQREQNQLAGAGGQMGREA